MRWGRLGLIAATAVIGLGVGWAVFNSPTAPRWTIAASGLLIMAGSLATAWLLIFVYAVLREEVRPRLSFRRPELPLSLCTREASLIGEQRLRHHPIRFWGVLTLNTRFAFGFMLFREPEYETLYTDRDLAGSPTHD